MKKGVKDMGSGGSIYGLGFIAALVFYIPHAKTFGIAVIGVLKSIVWPAFLVYRLMEFLKM